MLGVVSAPCQTQIWPTSDTNTIKASQFNGSNSIFALSRTNPQVPATHKGWHTKGLLSGIMSKSDSAVWSWSATGYGRGAYGLDARIASPSVSNGCAIFDSDWLDNRGNIALSNSGQAPVVNSGELISPVIDARGQTNMTLSFNQYYRNYLTSVYVAWSEDNGVTWKPKIQINTSILTNIATAPNDNLLVKLPNSIGTSTFRVKFIFEGNYYLWMVDDVKLIKIDYDLKINSFYAIAPNYITPKNQVEDMKFLLDITNNGNTTTNVKVKIFVYRVNQANNSIVTVYTDSLLYGTVQKDMTIENKILPNKLLASTLTPGQYYARYRVSSSNVDQIPANDTVGFGFFISDSLFAKESGAVSITRPSDGYWTANEPHTWRIGNYYYVKTGFGHTITTVNVRLGDPSLLKGQRIMASLYEWVDSNNDEYVQSNERTIVALNDTLFAPNQPAGNISLAIRLKDINTLRWFYPKNNKQYLAMIEFDPTNTTSNMQIGFNKGYHDYAATVYMTDSLSRAGVTGFKPRFIPILGKKAEDDWSTAGFGYTLIPTVRMTLLPFILKETTLNEEHKIEIYPNPAQSSVKISLDLPHLAHTLAIHIMDNYGHLIQEQVFTNIQKNDLFLNIETLAAGTYLLHILTPDGMRVKKLVVMK